MSRPIKHLYEFGPFRLDVGERLLLREEEVVPLTPKVFDLLLALVENSGHTLEKDELLQRVWPDSFVEEANLSRNIFSLRKALGEDTDEQRYIETVPRRGYRFVASVNELNDDRADLIVQERTRSRIVIEEEEVNASIDPVAGDVAEALARREQAIQITQPTVSGARWLQGRKLQGKKLMLVSAVLTLVAGGAAWFRLSHADSASALLPMRVVPLTSFPDDELQSALSPDGKLVAFAWPGGMKDSINIYVKQIGAGTPLRLTTAPGRDGCPVWSPDGHDIAFIHYSVEAGEGGIFIIPALGGTARKVYTSEKVYDLDWSPDGKLLVIAPRRSAQEPFSIRLLSLDSLEERTLTAPPSGYFGDAHPVFSPDGNTVAFFRLSDPDVSELYLVSVGGGAPQQLTFDHRKVNGLAWATDGQSLVFSSNRAGDWSLWRVAVSGGVPERVAVGGQNAQDPSISRQGNRLSFTERHITSSIYRISASTSSGDEATPVKLLSSSRRDTNPQLSPDGKRIAFQSTRSGSREIWICESDGANLVQLTAFGGPNTNNPSWSPDGRQLVFDSRPANHAAIFLINAAGGQPRPLTTGNFNSLGPRWSRDGQWIYFASDQSGTWQVWKLPAAGGAATQVIKDGGYEARESPDGQFLYYTRYGYGNDGIFRLPVAGGAETLILNLPQLESWNDWTVTNEGIYFIHRYDGGSKPILNPAIKFLNFATRQVTQMAALDKDPGSDPGLNLSPDGRWVIFSSEDYRNFDIMLVENFR